jgi:hypothetical protein
VSICLSRKYLFMPTEAESDTAEAILRKTHKNIKRKYFI